MSFTTLEAIPNVQAALPQNEWQAFVQRLTAELAQLGNLPRYEGTLTGSGAIAQGPGATSVGAGGVLVQGSVAGDVVTGTQTKQIVDPEKMSPQALRDAYLARLLAERNQLWLGGIDPQVATEERAAAVERGLHCAADG